VDVSVVTCWLGHHELAEDYLLALEAGPWPDEIIIVDNGGAPEIAGAQVLTPTHNLGFAAGSNLGLAHATCDAILYLNNDVALRSEHWGWLDTIRQALEPGVLVGQIRWDAHGDVDGHKMPYLDGWCLAGIREDLLSLGGFDETLEEPAYYSDNLLCLEARAAGMTLREVKVGLWHKENVTAGPARDDRVRVATAANRTRYLARARELLVAA